MSQVNSCGYCQRSGLPIFLLRPSVALKSDGFPELKPEWNPGFDVPESLSVVGRSLSEGFVYIYSEKYKTLDIYSVTERDDFYRIFQDVDGKDVVTTQGPCESCANGMEAWQAKTVSIHVNPQAKNGLYWFGWSESIWSQEVRKNHIENVNGCREKNMTPFDMDAWATQRSGIKRTEQDPLPFYDISSVVADYAFLAKDQTVKDEFTQRYPSLMHSVAVKGKQQSKAEQVPELSKALFLTRVHVCTSLILMPGP